MRFFKQVIDGYIDGIGTGPSGEEITESEYNKIMSAIRSRPSAECKNYQLRTDLTWEEYDLPPEPEPSDEDELSYSETLNILLGGAI